MRRSPKLSRGRAVAATVVALALPLAAGCGSSDSDSSGSTGSTSGGGKTGTITIWHNFLLDSQVALLDAQNRLFEEQHPGVEIKDVYVSYPETNQKLIAAAPTQTGPDVIMHDGSGAQELEQANAITDMTQCVSTWKTQADLTSNARRLIGDKTYGVLPYNHLVALWYNRTLLDKYGLEPPRTIDELETALEKVSAGGDTGMTIAGAPTFESSWSAYPFFTAYGVTFPDVDTPETAEVFARLSDWAEKGWVPRSVSTMDQVTAMQKFLTGKVAFTVNGNWEIDHVKRAAKFDYALTTLPSGSEPSRVYVSGETAMIGNFSKDPRLACDYLGTTWFSRAGQQNSIKFDRSIPTLRSMLSAPELVDDPVMSVFAKQSETADNVAGGSAFVANSTVWASAVSATWAGTRDPQEIASEAIDGVDRVVAGDGN